MNRLSIRQKILLLALLPALLLASISAWLFVSQARELGALSRENLHESLLAAKREQLANYMELALSAVTPLANTEAEAGRERIKAALRALRFDQGNGYFFAYDSHGVQVMSADNPAREGKSYWDSTSPDGRHLVREYVEAGVAGGGYVEYSWTKPGEEEPSPKLAYVVPVPGSDWTLGTGFYIDDLDAQMAQLDEQFHEAVSESLVRTGIVALLLLALIAALAVMLARGIHRPLRHAVETMENIAQGEGDLTRRLDASAGHELGTLAQAFNRFAEQVGQLVRQTRSSAASLGAASEELDAFMVQTGQGIATQHVESDQLATAMEQMSAAAQQVASSAAGAAEAAQVAEDRVQGAQGLVQNAAQVIDGLEGQVESGVEIIRRLGSESEGIGGVLDVIHGVAEQTNLLALNAAIEAARAGDQGRGFAVVADEVRTLAGRTQSSTAEIQEMISRLQAGAREAIAAIDHIRGGSAQAVIEVGRVGQALEEIGEATTTINGMNAQIAAAAEEQTQVCESINANVHQIVAIAEQTAEGSRTASDITQRLGEMAGGLQRLVGRYRAD
ncbi:methyl-accepting chemotaxis protein [Pseudomonas solani]|uniref:methyl-accepting chemotaxis protein n=1 Tax=Pseudomonas solani TaxID=2731552 RepID=UPI003C303BA2